MQQMIGKMAKRMYAPLIAMGFMMVAIAFVVGYLNSQTAAQYFAETKVVRETTLMAQRASIEAIGIWLPYFKFLGLGMILGGIVMALRVIFDNLQYAGKEVLSTLPDDVRPALPSPPWYGLLMPVVMMMGEAIFVVALIIAIQTAGAATQVFANPLPTIDAAGAGTALLAQLQTIKATVAWLVPLKFFGVATEFLAITMGLATIIYILREQTHILDHGIRTLRSAKSEVRVITFAEKRPSEKLAA